MNHRSSVKLFILAGAALFSFSAARAEQKIWDGTLEYQGSTILEDEYEAYTGEFINPNEHENYVQLRCLDPNEPGVLASVGTFRGLNMAASGLFTAFFQYDFDVTTTAFNHLNRALILKAKNRFEYLSYLLTGKKQKQLFQSFREGKIGESAFVKELGQIANSTSSLDYYRNLRRLRLSLPSLSPDYATALTKRYQLVKKSYHSPLLFPKDILSYLYFREETFFEELGGIQKFFSQPWSKEAFFGNDELYDRLRRFIADGKLHVLVGDLLGDKMFRSLGQALRNSGQTVKALDVSNAQQWIVDTRPPEIVRKYFDNVIQLPWAKNSRIFTTDEPVGHSQDWSWKYFVFSADIFGKLFENYDAFRKENPADSYEEFDFNYNNSARAPGLSELSIASVGAPTEQKVPGIRPQSLYATPSGICK